MKGSAADTGALGFRPLTSADRSLKEGSGSLVNANAWAVVEVDPLPVVAMAARPTPQE